MVKKLLLIFAVLVFTNCSLQNEKNMDAKKNYEEVDVNRVIHSWEEPNKFKLTINSLKVHDVKIKKLRSEFSYKKSEMVVILTYTYENISNDKNFELLMAPFYLLDEKGVIAENYPLETKFLPRSILPGQKITVQKAYGIKNKSDKLTVLFDFYLDKKYEATFNLDVEK